MDFIEELYENEAGSGPSGTTTGETDRSTNNTAGANQSRFWSELARSVTHDIRNPLTAISVYADLLPDRFDDPEFRQQCSDVISTEVERITRLMDRLDQFAEPTGAYPSPFCLHDCLCDVALRVQGQHSTIPVRIDIESVDSEMEITADHSAVAQAIESLLHNAVEACAEAVDPWVQVRCSAPAPHHPMMIVIADNGSGLPSEPIHTLFSPFFSTKVNGMGLGLPRARRILHQHGGEVTLSNRHSNGAIAVLTLPTR